MSDLKEITLADNPIADAEERLALLIAFLASRHGQTRASGDITEFTSVAVTASIANGINDGAYRTAVLTAAAEYIQRAAGNSAVNVGIQPEAA